MLSISREDIAARLRADNPWWDGGFNPERPPFNLPKRDYFPALQALVAASVKRAVIVLGARRVGKTTLITQLISEMGAQNKFAAVMFASVDTPAYAGLSLAQYLEFFAEQVAHDQQGPRLVVFDEIQYLPDWERHLKDLVDKYPNTRFIASGSAGAALKRSSSESGAGRFTDFVLPPLTFAEFLRFRKLHEQLIHTNIAAQGPQRFQTTDIAALNAQFVNYINIGGYPEAVFSTDVQQNFGQFVGRDIIDKVLLRDLPSLYGIQDIQELNRLFSVLAYNTAQEVSLETLSKNSGVAKNTIQRYLDYLEAAFLIHRVPRIDETAKRFTRQRSFKVYLTNPSMRAALFGPIDEYHAAMGAMAETAAFCQWLHSPERRNLCYARWKAGEVDIVRLDPARQKASWAYDVKWSDRQAGPTMVNDLKGLLLFAAKCKLSIVGASTKTVQQTSVVGQVEVRLFPLSLHCYGLGVTSATDNTQLITAQFRKV